MRKVLFIFEQCERRFGEGRDQTRFLSRLLAFALFITLSAAWSCPVKGQVLPPDAEGIEMKEGDGREIVAGVVRIKMVPDAAPLPTGIFRKGGVETEDPKLDSVLNSLRTEEIERVFREGGRFADRRRRYGLHLWYEVRIGEGVAVEDAVRALSGVGPIEYAGPVYRIRLSEDGYDGKSLKR